MATRETAKQAHLFQAPALDKLSFRIPDVVRQIIAIMLAKKRDDRYKNPAELIVALHNALNEQGVKLKADPQSLKTRRREKISPPETRQMSIPTSMNTGMMLSMNFCEDFAPEVDPTEVATMEVKALKNLPLARHLKQDATKSNADEVYLSRTSLENDMERALQRISFIEPVQGTRSALRNRIIYFPEEFETEIIRHLQKTFRRECWLLKEAGNPGEMEVEIDLEQAYILRHFYYYEDQLQAALMQPQNDTTVEKDLSPARPDELSQSSRVMPGNLETIDQPASPIGGIGNLETIDQPAPLTEGLGNLETIDQPAPPTAALANLETIDQPETPVVLDNLETIDQPLAANQEQTAVIEMHHSITDITLSSHGPKADAGQKLSIVRRTSRIEPIKVRVDLDNICQQKAWSKFCQRT